MEDLFTGGVVNGKPWLPQISPQLRAQLEELADLIVKYGREPSWQKVYERLEVEFPNELPATVSTVRHNVRALVKDRSGG